MTTQQALTDQQLDDIEGRLTDEHLTPGPWNVEYDYCDCSEYGCSHGKFATAFGPFTWIESRDGVITTDAEFAAHAREDVPALLAEIRRQRAELAATRTKTLATEADAIVAYCPDHGPAEQPTVWMDCHCAVADDMRRRAAAAAASGGGR